MDLPADLWQIILDHSGLTKFPIKPQAQSEFPKYDPRAPPDQCLLPFRTVCKIWNKLICQFSKIKTKGIEDHTRLPTIFTSLRSFNLEFRSNTALDLTLLTGLHSLKFDTTKCTIPLPWAGDMRDFTCLTNLTKLTLASKHITTLGPLSHLLTCLRLHEQIGFDAKELKRLPNLKSFGSYEPNYTALWGWTGYGVSKEADGTIYRGQLIDGGPEGAGSFENLHDGSIFEGVFEAVGMTGRLSVKPGFEAIYASQGGYLGQIIKGKKHGPAVSFYKNGARCETTWVDNQRQGPGAYYWSDGSRWEGTFVNNKREGKAVEFDGTTHKVRYEGNYFNDDREGQGTLYFTKGGRYEGPFVAGNRSGFGISYYPVTGVRMEANYLKDERTGPGVMYFPDGDRFECEFQHHKAEGNGILYCVDGSQQEMSFKDCEKLKKWDHTAN